MGLSGIFAKKTKPEFVIAGLGNPGLVYDKTRHNAGFMTIDRLLYEEHESITKHKFKSECAWITLEGKSCLVLKPQTYMNLSGEAVSEALDFYKLPPEKLIVVCDDISLDVSRLRIRRKGSSGGHNGLKSIIELLGSEGFPRIRLGVGKKPHPDYDLAKWVMSKFSADELKALEPTLKNTADGIRLIVSGKIDLAMNKFNS